MFREKYNLYVEFEERGILNQLRLKRPIPRPPAMNAIRTGSIVY
jgi:hypothetical protein